MDKVIGEVGEVIGFESGRLVVKMERKEACAKCRACSAGMKKEEMIIRAENVCNAQIGNKVDIVLDNANFMKATLIMYGLPFVFFMLGIFAGYYGAESLGIANGELVGIVLGLVLVVLTYAIIHSQEHRFKSEGYVPKAIKIVE